MARHDPRARELPSGTSWTWGGGRIGGGDREHLFAVPNPLLRAKRLFECAPALVGDSALNRCERKNRANNNSML